MVKNLPTVERSTKIRFGKNTLEDQAENTIVFNASDTELQATRSGAVYLSPIRFREDFSDSQIVLLMYNKSTGEITESGSSASAAVEPPLSSVTGFGNTTPYTIEFNNPSTSLFALSNAEFSNTISIGSLTPHFMPVVGSDNMLEDSKIKINNGSTVITSNLEVVGDITFSGNSYVIESQSLNIKDKIIGISNNNPSNNYDGGLIIENTGHNVGLIHHGDEDRFSMGYTQNVASDTHILHDSNVFLLDVLGNLQVQNNITVTETGTFDHLVADSVTIKTNSFYVDPTTSNVGIGTNTPEFKLDVHGTANVGVLTTTKAATFGATKTFVVTVSDASGANKYYINGVQQTLIQLHENQKYIFDLSSSTLVGHPFRISATATGDAYDTGITTTGTYGSSEKRTFVVPTGAPTTLYYYCTFHSGMGSTITIATTPEVVVSGNLDTVTATLSDDLSVGVDKLVVDVSASRVGIGTATPAFNLDVHGSSNVGTLTALSGTFTGDVSGVAGTFTGDVSGVAGTFASAQINGVVNTTGNLTVNTNAILVDALNKKVGIGKTPIANLDVLGNINSSAGITSASGGITATTGLFSGDGGLISNIQISGVTGDLALGTSTSGDYVQSMSGGDGITVTSGSGESSTPSVVVDLKSNGGLVIESSEVAVDLSASAITGTLAVADGGTGVTTSTGSTKVVLSDSPTLTGTLTAATANFSGDVSAVGGEFSGAVSGAGYSGGAITGTTGTFSGTLSSDGFTATSGQFNGTLTSTNDLTVGGNKLVVDVSTSNVGIGTSTPAFNLDVHGTANVGILTTTKVATFGTTKTFVVTVSNASGANKYYINGVQQPFIQLHEHQTYIFDLSSSTLVGHPFRISATATGTAYPGITSTGTYGSSEKRTFVVPAGAPTTLYYYCTQHTNMGATMSVETTSEVVVSGHLDATTATLVTANVGTLTATTANIGGLTTTTGTLTDDLIVGVNKLVVDVSASSVGIGTATPAFNLDVHGTSNVGTLTATTAIVNSDIASTSATTGSVIVTGGIGLTGNIYASGNVYAQSGQDGLSHLGRAKIGFDGTNTNEAAYSHENYMSSTAYALKQTATSGDTHLNTPTGGHIGFSVNNTEVGRFTGIGDFLVDTDTLYVDASQHSVGIETTTPHANLHVSGNVYATEEITTSSNVNATKVYSSEGMVINTGSVCKKFYGFDGTIANGVEPDNAEIKLTFSSNIFYAKIVAHLVEDSTEFSNMSLEVGGGSRLGGANPDLKLGSVSVFGNTSTNPWDSTPILGASTIIIKPSANINSSGGSSTDPALYNLFIEYITPDATNGVLSTIHLGSSLVKQFDY